MAQNVTIAGAEYEDVPAVKLPKTGGGEATFYDLSDIDYAASNEPAGNALKANGILFGQVDSTSTSTRFTAQIPGVTEYYDGLTIMLKNGVVTSASGFTININGLGGKQAYSNLAAATADTTLFNINYTMLFVYDSTRVSGGGWICYRGYDANTNTIGYQLRTNSSTMPMKQVTYRYRILFTSLDGQGWVPSNTSTSTNATAKRDVNQAVIDPFGEIVYYGTTASVAAGSNPSAAYLWQEYTITLGYAFNRTGAALVLPYPRPIYIKAAPQTGGGAIIDADDPYVFQLPSTEDGKIYIYLGRTYSATAIEMTMNHPIYYYKGGEIREWTNAAASVAPVQSVNGQTGAVVLDASDVGALPDDTAIPSKTSDLTNDSGFLTAETDPTVPAWAKAASKPSYTAQEVGALPDSTVIPTAATANPLMDGTAAVGTSAKWAKEDHVHPTDTSRQAVLVSGTNIKTVNGNSLLGSGNLTVSGLPSVTSDDNGKVLAVSSGEWSPQVLPTPEIKTNTYVLYSSGWSNNTQTIDEAYIVRGHNTVVVSPDSSSISEYSSCGVYCSGQARNELTFTCSSAPSTDITVNVMAINSYNTLNLTFSNPILDNEWDFYRILVEYVFYDNGEYYTVVPDIVTLNSPTISGCTIYVSNAYDGVALMFEGESVSTSNATITYSYSSGITRIIDEDLFTEGGDTLGFLLAGKDCSITVSGVNYSDY